MKQNFVLFVILLISLASGAQSLTKTLDKNHPVKTIEWGSRSTTFVDGFWEMVEPQLKKQFSKKLVDSIITYSMSMYYPSRLDKIDSINLYYIASISNNFGGSFHGMMSLLWVPYEENKFLWKYNRTRPNDFFMIFPKSAVVLEK
jgi:hypothetical protein